MPDYQTAAQPNPILTLERIAEIATLFVAQRDDDIAATWAQRGAGDGADDALLDAADAAAKAINDQVDPAGIVMLCALARHALPFQEAAQEISERRAEHKQRAEETRDWIRHGARPAGKRFKL